jgi:hypothetical protein
MTPRELAAGLEDVANVCMRGDLAEEIRRHIAALEKERDAALADNAALVRLVDEHHGSCPRCWLAVTQEQSHPGSALLEEHRKALDAAVAGAAEVGKRLAETHRLELVRSRNEGLERAAEHMEDEESSHHRSIRTMGTTTLAEKMAFRLAEERERVCGAAADDIRAMKESES